jgi:glycosyltransferase involved in cell wall biosynthesis
MKILFLSHHWTHNSHHSQHSGFKRIVSFAAESHEVTLVTWGPEDSEYREGNIRIITVKGRGKDYLFLKRISISRKGREIAAEFDAVHALFSDCTFYLPRGQFTMTLHVLPTIGKYDQVSQNAFLFLKYHIIQKRAFRRAGHIACVSTNLLENIPAKYLGKARFIPHGIDTRFWDPALAKPSAAFPEGQYVLCVGSHGLDREVLGDFIRANPSLPFVFVGIKDKLGDYPNTNYLDRISDEDLRDLYAGTALMIRPLLFSTANNSILEALAMGKTVLVSRIPGVTDYLTDETCVFIDTLKDRSLAGKEALRLDPVAIRRNTIQKFSWQKVLDSYLALYNQKQHG